MQSVIMFAVPCRIFCTLSFQFHSLVCFVRDTHNILAPRLPPACAPLTGLIRYSPRWDYFGILWGAFRDCTQFKQKDLLF